MSMNRMGKGNHLKASALGVGGIGKQGSMLKLLGTQARRELQGILGAPVPLQLWVKVREGWRDSPAAMRELGYDSREIE